MGSMKSHRLERRWLRRTAKDRVGACATEGDPSQALRTLALLGAAAFFSFLFWHNSFVNDDAFLAFRSVDNFVRGHGLRWNVGERVQSFTSPLYTLLMSAAYWVTHDRSPQPNPTRMYFTSMGLSYAISLFTVLWLVLHAKRIPLALAALILLLSSQAFVSFTSSGLETPLLYLFVALFYQRFLDSEITTPRELLFSLLIASLAVVTRIDSILLFLPACLWLVFQAGRAFGRRVLLPIALASLPLLLWFGFALVYFGSLLPNTYYAKLGVVIPSNVLSEMGRSYLALSFAQDPITLVVIGVGMALSAFRLKTAMAGLAIFLSLEYVRSIGGDNLGFRFLAPPFLLSVMLIHHFVEQRVQRFIGVGSLAAASFVLAYGALTEGSPIRAFRDPPNTMSVRFFHEASNLGKWSAGAEFPFARFHRVSDAESGKALRLSELQVSIDGGGLAGFYAGPRHHLIMPAGLTDPLLARLPIRVDRAHYPAHVPRPIPAGYLESIRSGENLIRDEDLAVYYEKVARVTQGPLFTAARWRDILELNFTSSRRYTQPYIAQVPPYPAKFGRHQLTLAERLEAFRRRSR